MSVWNILDGYGGERVVAVRATAVRKLGPATGILLSQFLYWQKRTKHVQGWFFPTQAMLEEETGLSVDFQQTARKHMVQKGFLEEKRMGIPAQLHYRLDVQAIADFLSPTNGETTESRIVDNPIVVTPEASIGAAPNLVHPQAPNLSYIEEESSKDSSKRTDKSLNDSSESLARGGKQKLESNPSVADEELRVDPKNIVPPPKNAARAAKPFQETQTALLIAATGSEDGHPASRWARAGKAASELLNAGYSAADVPMIAAWLKTQRNFANLSSIPEQTIAREAGAWKAARAGKAQPQHASARRLKPISDMDGDRDD